MKNKKLYTTGEFAKRSDVSIRTIRFYDKKGLLKPNIVNESGYRFYTDTDFVKLQKIIALKNLGFSLDEIAAISTKGNDNDFIQNSFDMQLKLVREKINNLKNIEQSILEVSQIFDLEKELGWGKIINLIHLINMQETLAKQYKNSNNIEVRIDFHKNYSQNPMGWFKWIYSNLDLSAPMKVLELGCGNGEFWYQNRDNILSGIQVVLSDISTGMLRSAKNKLQDQTEIQTMIQPDHQLMNQKNNQVKSTSYDFQCFDCHEIPYEEDSFDIIIANHLMFYLKDREKVMKEVRRVLKDGGRFYCTAYGKSHMMEIEHLVKEFDERIALSEVKLYDIFGLEHGGDELKSYFSQVTELHYEDHLFVTDEAELIDYIVSCHGNQMKYLQGNLDEFAYYIQKKIGKKGMYITKDAGMFCCYNTK